MNEKFVVEDLNVDDMFFIDAHEMYDCGINEKMDSAHGREDFKAFDRMSGSLYQTMDNIIDSKDNLLLAVKYIGNGVFEELVTGEKISCAEHEVYFKEGYDGTGKIVMEKEIKDCPYSAWTPLTYEDFKYEGDFKTGIASLYDYPTIVKADLDYAVTYPLSFDTGIFINEDSKKQYLRHTDEERKEIISKMKEIAKEDADKLKMEVTEIIPTLEGKNEIIETTVNNETTIDTDLTSLNNQLHDFKTSQRTK